jgi:Protein of unknown function (DUF4231)
MANDNDYIEKRVNPQIEWHSKKSQYNQHRYKQIKTLIIVCASLLPLLIGLKFDEKYDLIQKLMVGCIGVVITVSESLLSLNRYQELWLEYRVTVESLKREKHFFENSIGLYSDETTAKENLIAMTENLISDQNNNWIKVVASKEK